MLESDGHGVSRWRLLCYTATFIVLQSKRPELHEQEGERTHGDRQEEHENKQDTSMVFESNGSGATE